MKRFYTLFISLLVTNLAAYANASDVRATASLIQSISTSNISKVIFCHPSKSQSESSALILEEVAAPMVDRDLITHFVKSLSQDSSVINCPPGIPLNWILVYPVYIGADDQVICVTRVLVSSHVVTFYKGNMKDGKIILNSHEGPYQGVLPIMSDAYYDAVYKYLQENGKEFLDKENAKAIKNLHISLPQMDKEKTERDIKRLKGPPLH